MSRRFTVRRVFNKQVVVAGGQLLSRELVTATAAARGISTTRTVITRKHFATEKPLSLTDLAKACGYEDAVYFQSQREAKRWIHLLVMQGRGEIEQLERQREFKLHTHNPAGLTIYICSYYCDFSYLENDGCRRVFEDSKGMPLPEYELKRKWVEAEYGITIREV